MCLRFTNKPHTLLTDTQRWRIGLGVWLPDIAAAMQLSLYEVLLIERERPASPDLMALYEKTVERLHEKPERS